LVNTFQKIFKLILTFSALISGWTSIILLSNTTYDLEIKKVLNKMYLNQKNFIFDVKDLSLLLVKDANERMSGNNYEMTNMKIKNNEN
tara:strand:- start:328 stop:591 length:264 start_codon:yes stop_codon:yes gene_type:complete